MSRKLLPLLFALAACASDPPPPVGIGGTVAGLRGSGLVLRCTPGGVLTVVLDGAFTCPALVEQGAAYQVTVETQPSAPVQTCSVANGAGKSAPGGVRDVAVTCATQQYRVGGAVTGLAGSGLLLLDRGADALSVAADGPFAFEAAVPAGEAYDVSIGTQPVSPWQTCRVSGGQGSIVAADVSTVAVSCVTNAYAVGGQVTRLAGQGLVLQNGGDAVAVGASGPFTFPSAAPSGSAYDVSVRTQPASPWQTCTVARGRGTVAGTAVGDVAVDCATNEYLVRGTVTGLVGTGLVLQSGPDALPIAAAGTFTFPTRVASGSAYAVSVQHQPADPAQVCAVLGDHGTVLGGDVTVAVTCASPAASLDLTVDGAYVTQGSQSYVPSVPLVAGRPGLLRVFVKASESNGAAPDVEVRLTRGGSTVWARTLPAPRSGVPTQIAEADLGASWNLPLAAADLPAGDLSLAITVNPGQAVAESDYANDTLTLPLTAQALPAFKVTLVPVVLASGTGNVSASNQAAWLDRLQRIHPIAAMDVQVGAAFTPSVTTAGSDGTGWTQILSDLDAKRIADLATDRHYFGALHVAYASGVAGLGYTSQPTAIGWDRSGYPDGGNFPEVLAHEVGHNFGRLHAPCGNPASVDPAWPTDLRYQGALIGAWGWDASPGGTSTASLKDPAVTHDIMSYCSNVWASDYTYRAVLAFRSTSSIAAVAGPPQPCLLVSGTERDGEVQLRPAFRVDAVPTPDAGSHVLELRDAVGVAVRRVAFEPVEVADAPGAVRHFAVAVPVADLDPALVEELAVTHGGGTVATLRRVPGPVTPASPLARRERPGVARLSWDRAAHPRVMVRDPASGEVLGFAEGGSVTLPSGLDELEVHLSDGVGSERRLVPVR